MEKLIVIGCGAAGIVDEYWSGMGGGLLALAVLQIVRYIRYYKNPEYREAEVQRCVLSLFSCS